MEVITIDLTLDEAQALIDLLEWIRPDENINDPADTAYVKIKDAFNDVVMIRPGVK